jgi:hypothetical protein
VTLGLTFAYVASLVALVAVLQSQSAGTLLDAAVMTAYGLLVLVCMAVAVFVVLPERVFEE